MILLRGITMNNAQKFNRAHWRYEKIDHERKIVFIVDLNDGGMSVTNDAENVCTQAVSSSIMNGDECVHLYNYRLFYRDSEGQWDELLHDKGEFKDFKFGNGVVP